MRLSALAASVIGEYLKTSDPAALTSYSGYLFRSRFTSRLWMRRMIAAIQQPSLVELGCAALRLPFLRRAAAHVFFGRGSFPDVGVAVAKLAPQQPDAGGVAAT
jgi:hypothetical protein